MEPKEVVIQLGNQLTNKIIHEPTLKIKNALDCNDLSLIKAVIELYNLRKKMNKSLKKARSVDRKA